MHSSPLRVGSTGLDVQTIQAYLDRIRKNYPAIPVITDEAGVFGSSTSAAVSRFQSIFGLTADGIVGKTTWNKLSSIYTAVARLAELDSEGQSLGIGTVPPSSVLRQGSLQHLSDIQHITGKAVQALDGIHRGAESPGEQPQGIPGLNHILPLFPGGHDPGGYGEHVSHKSVEFF